MQNFRKSGKRGTEIGTWEFSRRLSDRQRQRPVCFCRECRGELYPGDLFWRIEGAAVCGDCLEAFARRYFAPCLTTGTEQLKCEEKERVYHDADTTVL